MRAARSPYRAEKKHTKDNTEFCEYCQLSFPVDQLGYWEDGRVCRARMGNCEVAKRMQRNWVTRLAEALQVDE